MSLKHHICFRVNEKIAVPTSIVLMATNTLMGKFILTQLGDIQFCATVGGGEGLILGLIIVTVHAS